MMFIPYCVCLVIGPGKNRLGITGIFSAWLVVLGLGAGAGKSLEFPLSSKGACSRYLMGQHMGGNVI